MMHLLSHSHRPFHPYSKASSVGAATPPAMTLPPFSSAPTPWRIPLRQAPLRPADCHGHWSQRPLLSTGQQRLQCWRRERRRLAAHNQGILPVRRIDQLPTVVGGSSGGGGGGGSAIPLMDLQEEAALAVQAQY
jgi:hypothetical protein